MYIFTYVYIHQLNKYTHTYRTTHVYTHTRHYIPVQADKNSVGAYMHAGHVYKLILMNASMTCVHIFRTYRHISTNMRALIRAHKYTYAYIFTSEHMPYMHSITHSHT